MKKIIAIIALSIVAFVMFKPSSKDMSNVLRVGTEGGYMPWNGKNSSGKFIGFEIDLANTICERTAMTCEFVEQDWDGMIPALLNNKFDVIMAGMTITDKRRETIDFSRGYADTGIAFASIGINNIQSLDQLKLSLKGKKIGVQSGAIAAQFSKKVFTESTIRTYGTQDELNIDLLAGRIDAGTNDTSVWYDLQKKEKSVNIVSNILTGKNDPMLGEGAGIGIVKGREDLLAKLDKALNEMRIDGTLSALAQKWFGFDASLR